MDKLYYDIFESPIGNLYLIFSGRFLSGLSFSKPERMSLRKGTIPKDLKDDLQNYFNGNIVKFNQRVKFLIGTEFEKSVWRTIKNIPFGETRTYKWVAQKIGKPSAMRAVGRALSKNPLPIIIPCHRVIESDGTLGGYSSGIDIKRRLLELEYYAKINHETK
jgi:methylated-DNA-[protein]-cysteine S-methyltransferase